MRKRSNKAYVCSKVVLEKVYGILIIPNWKVFHSSDTVGKAELNVNPRTCRRNTWTENWLLELADHNMPTTKYASSRKKTFVNYLWFCFQNEIYKFDRRASVHILLQYVHISHIKLIFGWVGLLLLQRESRDSVPLPPFLNGSCIKVEAVHDIWKELTNLYLFSHRYLYVYKIIFDKHLQLIILRKSLLFNKL